MCVLRVPESKSKKPAVMNQIERDIMLLQRFARDIFLFLVKNQIIIALQ